MPTRKTAHNDAEPPRKRAKLDNSSRSAHKFTSADEIRTSLRNQNPDSLVEVLTSLRNQFTVKANEGSISSQDERLLLAKSWMDVAPGAAEVFEIWENTNQRQSGLLALVISVLCSLLNLLSTQYTYHVYGHAILRTLLSSKWMQQLNSSLGGSHNEVIMATMKLFNAMSSFAGGRERKAVFEGFAWETKSLPKLMSMRRKGKSTFDMLSVPDIRTLYVLFILSFVDETTPSSLKSTFLEQRRDNLSSIFKGLVQDPYPVARKVLETCWAGVWSDPKVKRTLKVNIFNETTLNQLIKLYERSTSEGSGGDEVPADLVHHFLLAICTRPGAGVCFKDRGWYSREVDEDVGRVVEEDEATTTKGSRIYNKILANILKGLKVNEDPRQQELALKILSSCPELVSGYWSAIALTLEPRLSSKWIANVSFFGTVISLPIPTQSFLLPNSTLYQPSPPPLATILENVLPSVNTKAHFSRGLQSSSPLVQHCTALALAKCLMKYADVLEFFEKVEKALEEGESGQWGRRRQDLEREARRRVPEFQVVVALSQHKLVEPAPLTAPKNAMQIALLAESVTRVLWLYHRCLPQLVAEARFDVGKLLSNFDSSAGSTEAATDSIAGLQTLRQLHILRLLRESDQFSWSSKTGSHSHLYILLQSYTSTEMPAIRNETEALVRRVLSESVLFQHDADEVYIWLSALPTMARNPGTEAPDGAPLTDERAAVLTFLDDCIQRCMKTPYRYLEDLHALVATPDEAAQLYPSPLIMTVAEQLAAKVAGRLLMPSDLLAVVTFIRRLFGKMAGKVLDWHFLVAYADKIVAAVPRDKLFEEYPTMTEAILRELAVMDTALKRLDGDVVVTPVRREERAAVETFISQVEQLPPPSDSAARRASALELVDWIRLVGCSVPIGHVERLVKVVERLHAPAVKQLTTFLDPRQSLLCDPAFTVARSTFHSEMAFDSLSAHCTTEHLSDPALREVLVVTVFKERPALLEAKSAITLLCHRMRQTRAHASSRRDVLITIANMIGRADVDLSASEAVKLKEYLFGLPVVKDLCTASCLREDERKGVEILLRASIDPTKAEQRSIIATFASHWTALTRSLLQSGDLSHANHVIPWIRYMDLEELLDLFDCVSGAISHDIGQNLHDVVSAIFVAIEQYSAASDIGPALISRLRSFLALYPVLQDLPALHNITRMALEACLPLSIDGHLLAVDPADIPPLSYFAEQGEVRWSQRLVKHDALDVHVLLSQSPWSRQTLDIVKSLLYISSEAREACAQYLASPAAVTHSISELAPVLYTYLDTIRVIDSAQVDLEANAWDIHLASLLRDVLDDESLCRHRAICGSSLSALIYLSSSKRTAFLKAIEHTLQSLSLESITEDFLVLGRRIVNLDEGSRRCAEAIFDHGLQWAARHFATEGAENRVVVDALRHLSKSVARPKPHLVEPVLAAVVQNRLAEPQALSFADELIDASPLKPLVVNRHLQGIIQHSHFYRFVSMTSPCREAIISVLHTLFHQHPMNTCQPSHIQPLMQIYGGTLSSSDRRLLSIFQLFEETRKSSVASLLARWSSSEGLPSNDAHEALSSMDPTQVFRSCMTFPWWRTVEGLDATSALSATTDSQLYDPVFVALLCAQMLADSQPTTALDWVQFFRTNVVSLLIRSLSSKDDLLREMAITQIAAIGRALETADMQEKPHVSYILNLLRNALPSDSYGEVHRLPSFTTLLLAHALRGVFYPANFTYPLTARFLLQRPEVDTTDIPMLYNMLYSSTDDWKKERGWILKFLADAMLGAGSDEWRIFQRRHTWDLLASIWQSSESDRTLRNGVLEILLNLTSSRRIATHLLLKSALLTWVEMVIQSAKGNENALWLKIIENILLVVDPSKIESSTAGQWRTAVGRCLNILMDATVTPSLDLLASLSQVLLRLSLLPGPSVPSTPALLSKSLCSFARLEKTILSSGTPVHPPQGRNLPSPHNTYTLQDKEPDADPIVIWGQSIEALWRVAMTVEKKDATWDALTSRMLLWRSLTSGASEVAEWTREEVIRNLGILCSSHRSEIRF